MRLLKLSFNQTFLRWNDPFCCNFTWTREKHTGCSFGLMVFFLSNDTIFRKFQMDLEIVWVIKSRERERNVPKSNRRKVSNQRNNSRLSSRVIFHKFQIQIFLFLKFSISPVTRKGLAADMETRLQLTKAKRGNLGT